MAETTAERIRDEQLRLRAHGEHSYKFFMTPELRKKLDEYRGERPVAEFVRAVLAQYIAWLEDPRAQSQLGLFDVFEMSRTLDEEAAAAEAEALAEKRKVKRRSGRPRKHHY